MAKSTIKITKTTKKNILERNHKVVVKLVVGLNNVKT